VAGISFAADPSRHEDDPSALGLSSLFHLAANSEGVLLGPGGVFAVSTAHDAEAIDFAIEALGAALARAAEWLAVA
jgi:glutamate-1-semialdehyde aminotransferase